MERQESKMRERLRSLREEEREWQAGALTLKYRVEIHSRHFKRSDVARISWEVLLGSRAVQFRVKVEDIGRDREPVRWEDPVVILHAPAPAWMIDRPCPVLRGLYCLCVPSAEAGCECWRWWVDHDGDPEALWPLLREFYDIAFGTRHHDSSTGEVAPVRPPRRRLWRIFRADR